MTSRHDIDLDAYLAGDLDTRAAAQAEAHIEECAQCQGQLDAAQPPVDLPEPSAPPAWDERRMRRMVRRTLLRTVADALAFGLIALIVLTLASWLLVHPVLIDRGDRVERAFQATWDLAVISTPGAVVSSWRNESRALSRGFEIEVERPLGARAEPLGAFSTALGIRSLRPDPPIILPFTGGGLDVPFDPDRVLPGTVVTVMLGWETPIGLDDADALASEEVALTWVGFPVATERGPYGAHWNPELDLGYSACQEPPVEHITGFGSSGGSVGRGASSDQHGARHALAMLRRATANLAADPQAGGLLATPHAPVYERMDAAAAALGADDPGVNAVVLTGPTERIAEVAEAAGADLVTQLGVDFYNGPVTRCG